MVCGPWGKNVQNMGTILRRAPDTRAQELISKLYKTQRQNFMQILAFLENSKFNTNTLA